jgi:5'-nucleotidase
VRILLANDDGIYAPGLAALEKQLRRIGEVHLAAPATEQSGVGHSITYLTPLLCKEIYEGDRFRGYAVEGSPADCVKLAVSQLVKEPIDLVVSGINGGLNVGINVLYSGTVAAAIEGAFFRLNSFAVSLEYDPHADFDTAAELAVAIIQRTLKQQTHPPQLFNINLSTAAVQLAAAGGVPQVHCVPMGVERYGEHYIRRQDPKGRNYYWSTNDPPPKRTDHPTDLTVITDGHISISPLRFDLTHHPVLDEMANWDYQLQPLVRPPLD